MMTKCNYETIEQKIILGFFRGIWWFLTLPFKGLQKKEKFTVADKKYLIAKKLEIERFLSVEDYLILRHAVLEADKLLDWLLKKYNYHGKTFADRLRSAEKNIPSVVYNNIWQAHKVRNQLVHETDAEISEESLRLAIKKYLQYLNQL